MIHPIKTASRIYREVITVITELTAAINAQRSVQAELANMIREIERAAKRTADSVSYLERSEENHRHRAGQPTKF